MRTLSTLRFTRIGRVVVLVQGKTPPSTQDWAEYLDEAWSLDAVAPEIRTLVLTDGGAPDTLQRGSLTARVQRYGGVVTAVVSPATKARLIVTALGWFFSDIKFFLPDDLAGAFAFLELRPDEQATTIEAALSLLDETSSFDWERRLLATKEARSSRGS